MRFLIVREIPRKDPTRHQHVYFVGLKARSFWVFNIYRFHTKLRYRLVPLYWLSFLIWLKMFPHQSRGLRLWHWVHLDLFTLSGCGCYKKEHFITQWVNPSSSPAGVCVCVCRAWAPPPLSTRGQRQRDRLKCWWHSFYVQMSTIRHRKW